MILTDPPRNRSTTRRVVGTGQHIGDSPCASRSSKSSARRRPSRFPSDSLRWGPGRVLPRRRKMNTSPIPRAISQARTKPCDSVEWATRTQSPTRGRSAPGRPRPARKSRSPSPTVPMHSPVRVGCSRRWGSGRSSPCGRPGRPTICNRTAARWRSLSMPLPAWGRSSKSKPSPTAKATCPPPRRP